MRCMQTAVKAQVTRTLGLLLLLLLLALLPGGARAQSGDGFRLTILHTNDTHGRIDEASATGSRCTPADAAEARCVGGVARRATAIKQARAENDHVLLLDGGDQFQGTLYYTQYRGAEAAYFMDLLGYDAMAVGNHEFDDGPQTLAAFVESVGLPVLSANIDASDDPYLAGLIQPYTILEVGGERIGVVGYTTEDTPLLSSPGPTVTFAPIEPAVQAAVDALRAQGINKIVAVSHSGIGRDIEVATAVDGLDVIVAGHTNTYLSNTDPAAEGPYPLVERSAAGEPVLLVSAFAYGKYLGHLDMAFDAAGVAREWEGNPILLDASVPEDPAVLAEVARFSAPLEALQAEVVGTSTVYLDGDRASCRFGECIMGNLVTDAMLWATASEGTQIAIQNGGGLRSSIAAGRVSLGDVLEVLPFSNTIATFELTGADIWEALENGVSRANNPANEGTGRFPQVSGLRFTWSPDEPPGSRIAAIEVRHPDGSYAPIDPTATYKVATNDFLRRGGDGYEMFAGRAINAYDAGDNLEEVVAAYIARFSPISPQVEGRIVTVLAPMNLWFVGGLLLAAAGFVLAGVVVLAKRP